MLVGFLLYSFIDIRILPINQWFKIYMYNIFISIFDVMIYNTSTKHGCLDLALDPHRFLSSPLILSDSHSQRIYFVLFNILPKKTTLYFLRIYFKTIRCFGYVTSICILGSYWTHLFKLKLCWDLNVNLDRWQPLFIRYYLDYHPITFFSMIYIQKQTHSN